MGYQPIENYGIIGEQFIGRLQERYGLDRAEAENQLEEWQRSVRF